MIMYLLFVVISVIAIIAYDRIKYRKYYTKDNTHEETFVFLRANNAYIRKKLKEQGFNICPCALSYRNDYLYACLDRSIICGFNENQMHLIEDAKRNNTKMIDCARNLSVFIRELKKLDLK